MHLQLYVIFEYTDSELLFDLAGVGLRVQAVHVVIHRAKLIGCDHGVATKTRLQYGIMDKHILLLKYQHIHINHSSMILFDEVID